MATPSYPLADLLAPSGEPVVTAGGEPVYVVTDPAQAHDRVRAQVLELVVDRCTLTFGVAPCTATGVQCYNTRATCKDTPNYARGTRTWSFTDRGQPAPPGQPWRPYIDSVAIAPSEIRPAQGLALRSQTSVSLVDEPDSDVDGDPYRAARATPAAGTFWGRWQARNRHAVNRSARLKRGWWGQPFDFSWATIETYVIDAVRGPDRQGRVSVVLSDATRLLDKAQVPSPSSGKLAAKLSKQILAGVLAGAGASTAVLPAGASAQDGAYTGCEIRITGNTGAGQRRVIAGYSAATLTATLAAAWSVVPDSQSQFELVPLSLTLAAGTGDQYGAGGWLRIGEEVIRFTGRSGDVLSWPDGSYRAQFGTVVDDHNADALVQLCRVWADAPAADVVRDLLTVAGISAGQIDTALLASEGDTWLGEVARITACLSAPERASDLLRELLVDLGLMAWWEPRSALVKVIANVPRLDSAAAGVVSLTDDDWLAGSVAVERLDAERITQAALYYDLRSATESGKEPKHYLRGEVRIDADAESTAEYGDAKPEVRYSRWLTAANAVHVAALVARRLSYRRDAPHRVSGSLDPRTDVLPGDLVDVSTRVLPGADGRPLAVRARVVKVTPQHGQTDVVLETTTFGGFRWGWIAPDGAPDYGAATAADKQYAYIAPDSGRFADGSDAYRII